MEHLTAKPIVLVKIEREVANQLTIDRDSQQATVYNLLQKNLQEKFNDYHVFVITFTDFRRERDMIELECFYPKDFPAIDYEAFKDQVKNEINSTADAPTE